MEMPKLQEPSRVAYEASLKKEKEREVRKDIQKIEAVDITDEKAVEELHRYLDGKYQGCIAEWGKACGTTQKIMVLITILWESTQ